MRSTNCWNYSLYGITFFRLVGFYDSIKTWRNKIGRIKLKISSSFKLLLFTKSGDDGYRKPALMNVQIKPHSCISPSTITRIFKEFLATATKMCFEIYLSTNKSASKVTGHLLELPITQRNARAVSTGYTPKLSRLKVGTMTEEIRYGQDKMLNKQWELC